MNQRKIRPSNNALILQSDWEGGLSNVALDLMATGKNVTKVIFHAGDWIYNLKKIPTVDFDSNLADFEPWLRNYIADHSIDCIILYNQYRPYNKIGWDVAQDLDLDCLVFELGLLRPDYCSLYSRDYDHFDYLADRWDTIVKGGNDLSPPETPTQLAVMSTPCKMTQFAFFYIFSRFIATVIRRYRHYTDQRSLGFCHHLTSGIKGMFRFKTREDQCHFNKIFTDQWSGDYYVVPLQVHTDSQITARSSFESMEQFIELVVQSFIKFAPSHTKLIFKVHPMDRGYRDYHELIQKLQPASEEQRIYYLDRLHLPTFLDHARGCITINSSVGISALIHHTPTLAMGKAAYNLDGLTYQGSLDDFWTQQQEVNKPLVVKFINLLKLTSQAQGVLYQRLYQTPGRSKIVWPQEFQYLFNQKNADEPS